MSHSKKIPVSIAQRWRMVRYSVLPIAIFVSVGCLVAWIWIELSGIQGLSGHFMTVVAEPASSVSGRITDLKVELMQKVIGGQTVIAELDTRLLKEEEKILRQQLARVDGTMNALRDEIDVETAQLNQEYVVANFRQLREITALTVHIEELKIDEIEAELDLRAAEITLEFNKKDLTRVKKLVNSGIEVERELEEAVFNRDLSKKQGEFFTKELKNIRADIARSEKRLATLTNLIAMNEQLSNDLSEGDQPQDKGALSLPKTVFPDIEVRLEPIRAERKVIAAQIKKLSAQAESYQVIAPIDGVVTMIHRHKNDSVQAGQPIVTINGHKTGLVVAYVRATHKYRPIVGTKVEIQYRFGPRDIIKGTIKYIGPEMVDLEVRHRLDHTVPEWAVPIYIEPEWDPGVKERINPRPGELLNVRIIPPKQNS